MWKKLVQATAITSALYLVMGMSKPPIASSSAVRVQIAENFQHSFSTLNIQP
ncbi:MAG TPA: hypothetical protein V6C84_04695 [Coleofasciculaceae cyanobacterium]|jgi:uncharacterized membrane protein